MKLENLLLELTSTMLAQHVMGTSIDIEGNIKEEYLVKILPVINLALKDIYTKIFLQQEQTIIDLYEGITLYELKSIHSVMNPTPTPGIPKYINDGPLFPFKDNVVIVTGVFDELGREKFLNNQNEFWSINTPKYNVIEHPYPDKENSISVTYQSYPQIIDVKEILRLKTQTISIGVDPDSGVTSNPYPDPNPNPNPSPTTTILDDVNAIELDIPDAITEAIIYYVGSKIHTFINSAETMSEANFFKNKYSEEIFELENSSLPIKAYGTDTNIRNMGLML